MERVQTLGPHKGDNPLALTLPRRRTPSLKRPREFECLSLRRRVGRTKLWRLFQAVRVLFVREGPMVRIRFPPVESPCLAGFRPLTSKSRAFPAGVQAERAARSGETG